MDVIPDDGHVVVTVGSRVLVPEADDVAKFVHDDTKLVAVLADGDGLGPVSTTTHIGATPGGDCSRTRPRFLATHLALPHESTHARAHTVFSGFPAPVLLPLEEKAVGFIYIQHCYGFITRVNVNRLWEFT